MKIASQSTVRPHEGWLGEVNRGQTIRISGKSMIDFICFQRHNLKEYFDTARTRIYNLNIFPTAGQRLFSKQNNPMMRFLSDGFTGLGTHDLQSGHGCPELMLDTLRPLGSFDHGNLPDPMGLFRNMQISSEGRIKPKPKGPPEMADIDLEAEIDLICAVTNCPATELSASGANCTITIFGS
ncbi:MAG: DUF1989 domain-containing protein [Rhodospirillaceae bacterium]